MKTTRPAVALMALTFLSLPASATIVQIDFSGIFTSTTDQTGTVFRDGTGDNSAVGMPITGSILWDVSKHIGTFGCNPVSGFCISDTDIALHPSAVEASAFHWTVAFGGVEYNSDLNYGARDTVFLYDEQAGATQDNWNAQLYAFGHFQLEPEVNGVFDNLNVDRFLNLNLTDPSGAAIQTLDFSQPIDWTAGINGFGTGGFRLTSRIWEDGNASAFSGTPGTFLNNGGGSFVLTSFRSTQVPEPESLALLAIGLGAMFAGRQNRRRFRF